MQTICMVGKYCKKSPINSFKWVKKLFKFDEDFIKNYDENSKKKYVLEVDVEYPKNVFNLHKDLQFLAERKKIKKIQEACLQHI